MKELNGLRITLRTISKKYINNNFDTDSYRDFENCISDLLASRIVQSMEGFIQHSDITCLEHCMNVAHKSYMVCRIFGLDYKSAARGGLLHDLFLYDWHTTRPYKGVHAFSHPYIALENAVKYFELNRKEKDAIVKHMWPLTIVLPVCLEALVVSFADKYCALMETVAATAELKRIFRRILLKYSLNAV